MNDIKHTSFDTADITALLFRIVIYNGSRLQRVSRQTGGEAMSTKLTETLQLRSRKPRSRPAATHERGRTVGSRRPPHGRAGCAVRGNCRGRFHVPSRSFPDAGHQVDGARILP